MAEVTLKLIFDNYIFPISNIKLIWYSVMGLKTMQVPIKITTTTKRNLKSLWLLITQYSSGGWLTRFRKVKCYRQICILRDYTVVRCPSDRGTRPVEKSKQDWKGSAELGRRKETWTWDFPKILHLKNSSN